MDILLSIIESIMNFLLGALLNAITPTLISGILFLLVFAGIFLCVKRILHSPKIVAVVISLFVTFLGFQIL